MGETYLFYGIFAGIITFIAGVLPFFFNFGKIRYIIAFSAGVVIATVFLELLPETNLKNDAWIMAMGFLLFYVIGKLTILHSCAEVECAEHTMNMTSVVGMSLDNIIDGIAITVGYLADPHVGFALTIAVIIHEIPQDLSATVIMKGLGYGRKKMLFPIVFAALCYPVGSYIAVFIPQVFHEAIIAFVAGTFIYIGVGDLLTEAHKRFNINVVLSVLAGFVLVFVLEAVMRH